MVLRFRFGLRRTGVTRKKRLIFQIRLDDCHPWSASSGALPYMREVVPDQKADASAVGDYIILFVGRQA